MKKTNWISLLVFLMLSVFTYSCTTDEEDVLSTQDKLTQTPWLLTNGDFQLSIPGLELPDSLNDFSPVQPLVEASATLSLKDDNSFDLTTTNPDTQEINTINGTWTLDPTEQFITLSGFMEGLDDGGDSGDDDPITPEMLQQFEYYSIDLLTGDVMDLSNESTIEVEFDGLPFPVPVTVNVNLNFEKAM